MPHESPLTRQWILLSTLSARRYGATVKELAEELEVGLKTIHRDLTALQAAGLPLEETVLVRGLARYVGESVWHPSQELRPQKDGSLIAKFHLDGTREIKAWILSFGRHAEVLEPEELRVEVEEMAKRYRDAGMRRLSRQERTTR